MRYAAVALLLTGCEILVPHPEVGPAVEPPGLTGFAALEAEIFVPRCALASCHGDPLLGPMSLAEGEGYGNLVGVASVQVPEVNRIEPGEPDESYLLLKVAGRAAEVGGRATQMPLNRTPLSEEDIQRIADWILEGAPPSL